MDIELGGSFWFDLGEQHNFLQKPTQKGSACFCKPLFLSNHMFCSITQHFICSQAGCAPLLLGVPLITKDNHKRDTEWKQVKTRLLDFNQRVLGSRLGTLRPTIFLPTCPKSTQMPSWSGLITSSQGKARAWQMGKRRCASHNAHTSWTCRGTTWPHLVLFEVARHNRYFLPNLTKSPCA